MNEHFANLVFFLLWAEKQDPNMTFGSVRIDDAIDSLAVLFKCDPKQLRELI